MWYLWNELYELELYIYLWILGIYYSKQYHNISKKFRRSNQILLMFKIVVFNTTIFWLHALITYLVINFLYLFKVTVLNVTWNSKIY